MGISTRRISSSYISSARSTVCDDVPQLAVPLPAVGGLQLLFLDGHLPAQPLEQVRDGLADRLALLAHGVTPVPEDVVAVQ